MWFRKHKIRLISCLLCLVMCVSFSACAEETSGKETGGVIMQEKEGDYPIPEEITMELLGLDVLHINRPMWEEYIYSIYDLGKDDGMATRIPIGNYEVMHNYMEIEKEKNFNVTISYNNDFGGSQILFDKSGKLKQISITKDMGEEFSTSFLNIGDNVKDYFEASKKGLWEEFLSAEKETIVSEQGWIVRRGGTSTPDYTYDNLQLYSKDLFISYLIKDEVVDYILVYVYGDVDVSKNSKVEAGPSIYDLESFDFYIKGKDITEMTGSDWVNSFSNSFEEIFREFFEFSEKNSKYGNYKKEATTVVDGLQVRLNYTAYEDYNWMAISTESVSKLKKGINPDGTYTINFMLSKEGTYSIELLMKGESSFISSNYIMPGDNIRTFLNSYEEGLFEKITSLSDGFQEYSIGPYYFTYSGENAGEESLITIGKRNAEGSFGINVGVKNEIVTHINRHYIGSVSGYEDEPVLW